MQDIPIIYEVAPKVIDKIKTDVREVIQSIFKNHPLKKMSVSRWWIFLAGFLPILGIVLIVLGITAKSIFLASDSFVIETAYIIFYVFASLSVLLSASMFQVTRRTRILINNAITNKEIVNYYNSVAQNHLPYWTVSSIEQDFDAPLVIGSNGLTSINVVYGMCGNYQYEFGTKYEVIRQRNKNTYIWYRVFTCRFDNTNFQTNLEPENGFTRLLQSKSNNYELESIEFEKMFIVDYTHPIQLRKILTPAVMNNLVQTGIISTKNDVPIPSIYIKDDQCIIMWKAGVTNSQFNSKEIFGDGLFVYSRNFEKMVDNLTRKLLEDMRKLTIVLRWAASFNRWEIA